MAPKTDIIYPERGKNTDYHTYFGKLTDDEWLNVMLMSVSQKIIEGYMMPGFPSRDVQTLFTSHSYDDAINEAFHFYRVVKESCNKFSKPLGHSTKLLDFGVGWGRIIRMFLRDVDEKNMFGVDVNSEILQVCESIMPCGKYLLNEQEKPLPFQNEAFDLVVGFSVFSHLSPLTQQSSLLEIERVLAPGGIGVFTTLSPRFLNLLENAIKDPTQSKFHTHMAQITLSAFPNWNTRLNNKNDMLYLPSGGGIQGLEPTYYGWAMVPENYLNKEWGKVVDVVHYEDNPLIFDQAYFVIRKRSS